MFRRLRTLKKKHLSIMQYTAVYCSTLDAARVPPHHIVDLLSLAAHPKYTQTPARKQSLMTCGLATCGSALCLVAAAGGRGFGPPAAPACAPPAVDLALLTCRHISRSSRAGSTQTAASATPAQSPSPVQLSHRRAPCFLVWVASASRAAPSATQAAFRTASGPATWPQPPQWRWPALRPERAALQLACICTRCESCGTSRPPGNRSLTPILSRSDATRPARKSATY